MCKLSCPSTVFLISQVSKNEKRRKYFKNTRPRAKSTAKCTTRWGKIPSCQILRHRRIFFFLHKVWNTESSQRPSAVARSKELVVPFDQIPAATWPGCVNGSRSSCCELVFLVRSSVTQYSSSRITSLPTITATQKNVHTTDKEFDSQATPRATDSSKVTTSVCVCNGPILEFVAPLQSSVSQQAVVVLPDLVSLHGVPHVLTTVGYSPLCSITIFWNTKSVFAKIKQADKQVQNKVIDGNNAILVFRASVTNL